MTFQRVVCLALALVAIPTFSEARPKRPGLAQPARSASAGQAIVVLINRYRAQHGLGPVSLDARLTQAAAYQARSNAQAGTLSHDVGGSFRDRMTRAGIRGGYSAENLGAGSLSVEQVFAMWQASPQHNSNMLIPRFRRIGMAYAEAPSSAYGRFWALQLAD